MVFVLLFVVTLWSEAGERSRLHLIRQRQVKVIGSFAKDSPHSTAQPAQVQGDRGLLEFEILDCYGPRAARITLKDGQGRQMAGLPGVGWIWVDGVFRGSLPTGLVNIHLTNGPRMAPWQGAFDLNSQKPVVQNTVLGNFAAVAKQGWWICDPYIQADAGQDDPENFSFSRLSEVTLATRAEGVEIAGIGGCWNLANREGTYGNIRNGMKYLTVDLLRSRRKRFAALYAWKFERKNEVEIYVIEPSPVSVLKHTRPNEFLFESITNLHDRGALVIAAHPMGLSTVGGEAQIEGTATQLFYNMLAGVRVDAVDISCLEDDFYFWQVLLNEGYQVTAVGGGPDLEYGSSLDIPAIGCYHHVKPGRRNNKNTIDAIKQGNVIVSNRPFINLAIDNIGVGKTIHTPILSMAR